MSMEGVCGAASWGSMQQATADSGVSRSRPAGEGAEGDGVRGTHEGHRGHHAHHGHHAHRGHHHHGGGGFVQAIRDVLTRLMADAAAEAPAETAGDAPAEDAVTTAAPVTDPAADPASTEAPPAGAGPASRCEVRHALHAFMHALFQTVAQAQGAAPAPGAGDTDGDGDGAATEATEGPTEPATSPSAPMARYRSQGLGLHGMMQNVATDGAVMDLTALETSFQNLLTALGAGDSGVTLQSFLQALLDHLGGASSAPEGPAGTLVETAA